MRKSKIKPQQSTHKMASLGPGDVILEFPVLEVVVQDGATQAGRQRPGRVPAVEGELQLDAPARGRALFPDPFDGQTVWERAVGPAGKVLDGIHCSQEQ